MEPVLFVMAIMGCGDGQTVCREARVEPVRYHSVAECQANLAPVLARSTDLDFPEIAASCRRERAEIALARPARVLASR